MTRLRRAFRRRGRVARGNDRVPKDLRASLLEILEHRELELLRVRQTLEAREFSGEVECLGNEALIFAIEEQTDLAERFKVLFLGQLHHVRGI
jgi:hypothetical protein